MSTTSYPIQLRLAARAVVVFGAGHVASRKITRLVQAGAQLRVIAPDASEQTRALAAQGALHWEQRTAEASDCTGAFMVVCATSSRDVNASMAYAARAVGALVLRVDAPEDSDFSVPARAQSESVDATVSTHGRAPSASRRLGRELRHWVDSGPELFVATVARARLALWERDDADTRLRALSDGPLFEACRAGDQARVDALFRAATAELP